MQKERVERFYRTKHQKRQQQYRVRTNRGKEQLSMRSIEESETVTMSSEEDSRTDDRSLSCHLHFTSVKGVPPSSEETMEIPRSSLQPRPRRYRQASLLHRSLRATSPSPSASSPSSPLDSSSPSSLSSSLSSSSFVIPAPHSSQTRMPPPPRRNYVASRRRGYYRPAPPPNSSLPPPPPQIIPPWKHWESVAVNIADVPKEANTFILWQAFSKEGRIFSIDLFEDFHGKREHRGKLRFRPPPQTAFWARGTYVITLTNGQTATIALQLDKKCQNSEIPSPVRPNVSYPAEVKLPILTMDIGVMFDETTMLPMRTVGAGTEENASLVLDLKSKAMFVYFQLPIFNTKQKPNTTSQLYHEYRLKIPFTQLTRIFQTRCSKLGTTSHLTFLNSPPIYHRRIKNIASTFIDENAWRDSDTWFRQTYIVHNPQELATLPVSLRKAKPVIDIGRWNTLNVTYSKDTSQKGRLALLCEILNDYNVTIEDTDRFVQWDESKERIPPVWKWIDQSSTSYSSSLEDLMNETYVNLPFSVRYQLEVCISNGYLSEFTMTREFPIKLSEIGETQAKKLLEYVASRKRVYYDPMKIFNLEFVKGVTDAKIPPYCCYMRSARITPSTIYFNSPSVDISNRVIRYFIEYADRFLRVSFTDEKLLGRINSTADNTMDEVFTRIKRALANGIVVGDRRYEFLAFGNSQFREHGAYFFAPLDNLTAANIRAWMGHFNDIRNVAKYAARLGQCFSTTRAVVGSPVNICKIGDIRRNDYTFSDGIGRISKFLAQMAMTELKIKTPTGDPPSAFQFRLGGCKGMLTVSPEAQRQEVHIRKSQYKFAATHSGLEIIRWSQFSMATLNRQLIIVLSTLGIPDAIFHTKLKSMLKGLDEAMESDSKAIELLQKYVDPNQMTLTISQIVLDGFRRSKEPFLTSVLTLWRAWHLKYLKEKARIAISQGASLLGCMDETATLKGHFYDSIPKEGASYEEKLAALPEIFVQISRLENGGKYEVIEGLCLLARNPSLHPGDIRVVRAVNVPELQHLQDVVVLPQTGDRDIASMCSGGDLDGDDYLVIWDQDLLPEDWFTVPMNYTSNKARDLDHDVTVDEITSFFVTYIKNDCLPRIAHAHLAWADRLEGGVNEEKCIRLAQLHSDAVDYNKTGNPANMTRSLQPRMWPHFMEKKNKSKDQTYRSSKILGQLYDAVERIDFAPNLEMPFDKRILECTIEVSEDLIQFARNLKQDYDSAMRRVMAQHEIKNEFEVWSTFILSHANMSKDYKFHEEIGGISLSLREGFRKQCYEKVGGRSFELLTPLAIAMYRVTHEEMAAALKKFHEQNPMDAKFFHKPTPKMEQLPLISFPWILPNILGKIARGQYEEPNAPINTVNQMKVDSNIDEQASEKHDGNSAESGNRPASSSERTGATQTKLVDHFDLFTEDLETQRSCQIGPGPVDEASPTGEESVESLDQLADFGFIETPKSLPSTFTSPSTDAIDTDVNLLDLDESPKNAGSVGQEKENQSPNGVDHTINGGDEDAGCLDMVEEESDVKPNALDMLNKLLGA
ncbi:hypothetical protein MW887_002789 [Aspergillus wentii]|nr:hypothetical protein MW887_002789 [Aspergillus wentii]